MKNSQYKSIYSLFHQQTGKKLSPFMTTDQAMKIKYNVYQFPIKQHHNQERRKNDNFSKLRT